MEPSWIILQVLNTAMLFVIAYGIAQRRRPRVHMPVMGGAFLGDVILVGLIESRARGDGKGAVEQGVDAFSEGGEWIEQFHIIVSVLCILGYVVALVTGLRLQRSGRGRKLHRWNAGIFIVTRLSSYVTSYWMG